MYKVFFPLLLSLVVAFGCKPRNNSQLKHDFGSTSRVPDDHKFEPCQITFESKMRFPQTQVYLRQLAMHIMGKNPQVFKKGSVLDPEKFCINVKYDETFNAYALPNHRNVEFHTATILSAENDAALAAVMAHELAHITMLHDLSKHPKFKPAPGAMKIIKQSQALYRQVSTKMMQANRIRDVILNDLEGLPDENKTQLQNELLSMFDGLFEKIIDDYGNVRLIEYADKRNEYLVKMPTGIKQSVAKNLDAVAQIVVDISPIAEQYGKLQTQMKSQLLKSPEVGLDEGMNWQEQEADEVGFEFYRRAEFRDDEFFNMLYLLAITSGEVTERDVVSCMQKSFKTIAMKKDKFEPPRGFGSHPDYCWRIFDHQREQVLHEKDYALFPNNRVIISASGLANARAEIKADPRSKKLEPGAGGYNTFNNNSSFPGEEQHGGYPGPSDGENYPQGGNGDLYPPPNGGSYPNGQGNGVKNRF